MTARLPDVCATNDTTLLVTLAFRADGLSTLVNDEVLEQADNGMEFVSTLQIPVAGFLEEPVVTM